MKSLKLFMTFVIYIHKRNESLILTHTTMSYRENVALMLSEVLTEGMGYVIGKADKRYTLWSYNYEFDGKIYPKIWRPIICIIIINMVR